MGAALSLLSGRINIIGLLTGVEYNTPNALLSMKVVRLHIWRF